ncbi:acyl-CoA dehydrogenase family protein [Nocardia sp. NPDC047654]|uniref:acyl-CoA dehydrogenase family protein n=1 Tax=Nocardia sp. NPDC047654 TaxID=3364314 RepID=UPI00371B887D
MAYVVPERIRPLREQVRRFVDDRIIPHERLLLRGGDEADALRTRLITEAKSEGLWAMGHPADIGGRGLPWLDYAYVNEVIGRSDPAMHIFGSYSVQTCLMLDKAVTDSQRAQILLPAVQGEFHVAFAVTEPGAASSDPTTITTTARLEGDEWVINGRKWYTSAARTSDWICVMCRTESDDAPRHERFSMILVPSSAPGYTIERDVFVMGLNSNHPECSYTDVRVPRENLLGERGQGFSLFQTRLGPARLTNCMRWLGQAQRAFDLMCDRINTRQVRGGVLADKQLMQHYVYQSYTDIHTARMMVLDAAEKMDAGRQARVEISAVKTYAANMLQRVLDRAVQVHGALGVCDDTPLEQMYRMARIYRIVDGPDEVHIERVGKTILKQYAEGRGWDFATK